MIGGKLCGQTIPSEIVSSSNYLNLRFRTDNSAEFKGFKIYAEYAGKMKIISLTTLT